MTTETAPQEMAKEEVRKQRGIALYGEMIERFARMLSPDMSDETAEQILDEFGFLYLYSIDDSDAALFREKIGLAEGTWRDRFLKAVALHRHGRLNEAEEQYKVLLKDSAKNREIDYNLAALYLQQGNVDLAVKHLEAFEKYLDEVGETTPVVEEFRQRARELRAEMEDGI